MQRALVNSIRGASVVGWRLAAVAMAASLAACRPATEPTVTPILAADGRGDAGTRAPAARSRAQLSPLRSVEGITEYRLDNGLRVLLVPDASRDRVTVNMTYLVGSRHEGYGETGMAHLLEHMLFKGTSAHPEPSAELELHGADYNGTTWYDRTNYFETMPATDDNLAWAIAFEADRMVNCPVSAEDLSTEFSVVRNELEMGENDPFSILDERMLSTAFLWHNYGKSTIGAPSDLENVPAPRLQAFYRAHYRPDNAVLVIAGAFESARALELVQQYFAGIEVAGPPAPPTYTVEPVQDGERTVELRRTGDVGLVSVLYHGVSGASEGFVAGEALVHLLTDEPSGRLYRGLVQTGLASAVYGHTLALHDPGWIEITAEVADDRSTGEVRAAMLTALDSLDPPTEVEVARYRNRRAKDLGLSLADTSETAIELSEWAALGDWRMLFVYRDRVEAVTAEQVGAFAERFVRPSNRTVGVFTPVAQPQRAPSPQAPDVAALVEGYRGRGEPRPGEVFEASLDNVESRTHRSTLAGGVRLALVPKRTRGGLVTVAVRLRAGSVSSLRGRAVAAAYVGDMLMRGTTALDRQQLRDELDRLRAQMWISGDVEGAWAFVTTVRDNVPAAVELLASVLREPALSADEFRLLKQEQLARWRAGNSDPQTLANDRLFERLRPYPQDDPRAHRSNAQWIAGLEKLRVRDLARLHREQWGASDLLVAAIGDFDEAGLGEAVAEHLGTWASAQPYQRFAAEYEPLAEASLDYIDTPDKEMAVVLMAANLALRDDDPDYPALQLGAYLLGGADASALVMRLREKEGWSYSAYASLSAGVHEPASTVLLGAQCAPANAERVREAMAQELARLIEKGVSDEQLAAAKKTYRAVFETRLSDDQGLAMLHLYGLEHGRTLEHTAARLDAIDAVTAEQLREVLGRRLGSLHFATVVAGDFEKMGRSRSKP